MPMNYTNGNALSDDHLLNTISVYVDLNHTYRGDLVIQLTNDTTGTSCNLHSRSGGSSNDIKGYYGPSAIGPFSNNLGAGAVNMNNRFNGEQFNGGWTMTITDNANADGGIWASWGIMITSQ